MVSQLLSGITGVSELLKLLLTKDTVINGFSSDFDIIQQGLAPLIAQTSSSVNIQKANLLERVKFKNWLHKAHILFDQLHKSQIKFIVFKGFAYTFLLYEQTHIRPYSDIDILIDQGDYPKFAALLSEMGYQCFPSRQGQFISFQNSFFDSGTPSTTIDLHWQISNKIAFHQHFSFYYLYLKTQSIQTDQHHFKILSDEHAFIHGSFHYYAHCSTDRKHIWLYDLALLWSKMEKLQQGQCLEIAHDNKQSSVVNTMLNLLTKVFPKCLIITQPLKGNPDEITKHYIHDKNNKLRDFKTRLRGIKGSKNKLKYISEYVFQDKIYVQQRYGIQSNIGVYLYYPRMWVEDFIKLFR